MRDRIITNRKKGAARGLLLTGAGETIACNHGVRPVIDTSYAVACIPCPFRLRQRGRDSLLVLNFRLRRKLRTKNRPGTALPKAKRRTDHTTAYVLLLIGRTQSLTHHVFCACSSVEATLDFTPHVRLWRTCGVKKRKSTALPKAKKMVATSDPVPCVNNTRYVVAGLFLLLVASSAYKEGHACQRATYAPTVTNGDGDADAE